jgi:structural maintenance of chromosome 1
MGRLVKLELENFKSYQGRQVIGPFDDFTSIIGPNGSGKSNLMDAISFVLGVNSSQLRSSHLVDLINRKSDAELATSTPNGTKKRGRVVKEQGAQKATVAAFYLKSTGQELVFARSVNSTGASEYSLNGRAVPFADYNQVLETENILIKARNFLVFQGDVEAIASKSPKDLTRLVEQISGSDELKDEYERLRDIQDKAMEASTFAFNKKRTLTNEIKAVQDQKDDAVKYEQLVLQRMDLISEQVMWKLFHVEAAAKECDKSIEKLRADLGAAEANVQKAEAQVKDSRKSQAKVNKDVLALEKQLKKAQADLDACAPESLLVDEKHRFVANKLKTLQCSRSKQAEAIDKHNTDLGVVRSELEEIDSAFKEFERRAAAQAAMYQLSPELSAEYHELKQTALTATAKERLKLEALEHKISPTLSTIKQREEKAFENESRRKQLQVERGPLAEKREEVSSEHEQAAAERRGIQRELAQMLAERTRLQQSETETSEKLRGVMEKLMQAKIDRQESDREVKLRAAVESLKRMFSGVYGRMVDLCQPAHKKYDQALSIVLGRNMDAIVVDSEQTAIDCIQYMRQQRAGHATFIPLDSIKARPVQEKYRSFASGVRPAVDVISFDAAYSRAFAFACEGAVICDTLDVAKYVCYEREQHVKAVTLDGSVIHKSGLLTGGSAPGGLSGNGANRRWEEKQVTQLKNDRDGYLVTLSDISKQLKHLEKDQKLRTALAEKEARVEFLKEELHALERRIAEIDSELGHLASEDAAIAKEIAELTGSISRSQRDIAHVQAEIWSAHEGIFKGFCAKAKIASIQSFEDVRATGQRQVAEKSAKFTTLTAKLSNQLTFLTRQVSDAEARLQELDAQLASETETMKTLEAEKAVMDGKRGAKLKVVEDLRSKMTSHDSSMAESNEQLAHLKKKVSEALQATSRVRKEITTVECELERRLETRNSLLKKCRLEEIDLPLLRGSLHDISLEDSTASATAASGIVVDFSVLGKEGRARSDDAFEQSYYAARIRGLQEEIDRLVPNLRALDKLESVELRLKQTMESFEHARLDAKKARDEFLAIKARRSRLFTAAFKHISEAIDPIYKELTRSEAVPTGGTAYLSLEDADEPYLEGIKYHAMPPMKRFLDMEQLSGGEKTVAALALLFALHSFRPSPFFILDEIDAALDNANVQRVAAFIRAKSHGSTQFIVISLKGSLYERAEALIGIYKDPEVRSSRVLSLKLTDYPEQ